MKGQLNQLNREIEECECELKREKKGKRVGTQPSPTKLETDIKNHQDHIHNLELILRQLDNNLIDPYKLDAVLDAVDDYLASYKQPDFFFDTSIYDIFAPISGIPKSDSETGETEETDSITVRFPKIPTIFVERKNEFDRFAGSVASNPRGSANHAEKCNAREFGEFYEFESRGSCDSRGFCNPRNSRNSRGSCNSRDSRGFCDSGYPSYPSYPSYSREFGLEK